MNHFSKKTLTQIKWWAWLATVLPLTALAGMFFVEFFGSEDMYRIALAIGATIMFSIAVVWWWWAIWIIANITGVLSSTVDKIEVVDEEIKSIRKSLRFFFDIKDNESK